MVGIITTGNIPRSFWEGMNRWWGREYAKWPKLHAQIFEVVNSKKKYEEDGELTGLGLAAIKPEAAPISFDSELQGTITRYTHVTYALGVMASLEEQEDCLYEEVSRKRTSALAFSMETTRQIVAANFFNRGFDANYVYGDGSCAFVSDHATVDGTQSNVLNPAADASEAALEDLCIMVMTAKNSRGHPIVLQPMDIIIHPQLRFEMRRILGSEYRSGTADNDDNAIKALGIFGKEPIVNPYLTDTDAFFIKTNCPNGWKYMERRAMTFDRDNDFDTKNIKFASTMRFVVGQSDFRGGYASAGA